MSPAHPPDSRFRILLTNSSSIYGGGEFYVLELARALGERGHAVWVSCRPDNLLLEKCKAVRVPVLPLEFPERGRFPTFIRHIASFAREHGIQLIHSNANYDRTASAFAARIAGCAHVTNVHSYHSIQHNLTHWVRNHVATDHYLVDGYCVKELLEREDRIRPRTISVVYLGVDPATMRKDWLMRQNTRAEFGFDARHVVVGSVGRLVPFKGHAVLLHAFAKLASGFPTVRLVIVGDGELDAELRGLVARLSVGNRTVFTGFRDDLQAIYSAFDIFVHPSLEGGGETFPFAVLQALSQELPVVVTKVGDVPAMVQNGRNGYVVPDGNVETLAGRLSDLISNESTRNAMSAESLRVIKERFTLVQMVERVEAVYRSVLELRMNYR